jgi:hypothetical protein
LVEVFISGWLILSELLLFYTQLTSEKLSGDFSNELQKVESQRFKVKG